MLPVRLRMPAVGMALMVGVASLGASALGAGTANATAGVRWTPTDWTGVVGGAPVPGIGLPPAPLPAPLTPLPAGITPLITYEPQTSCDPSPKPGALRLAEIIRSTYGAGETVWIPRGCDVGDTSEHKEGRAADWMVSVRSPQERANAEAFLNWLLGPDQFGRPYGHAQQLGVMYIGWHDRIWRGYEVSRGWQELKGCFSKPDEKYDNYCHRNHIHISLTRQGASGLDPTTTSATPDPALIPDPTAPPAPEAAPPESVESDRPLAPAQPGADSDLFMSIGSEPGFGTASDAPLQPRQRRTVDLSPLPLNATSALISITTKGAPSETGVRVGILGRSGANALVRARKARASTSVVSVPVVDGALQLTSTKAAVQVHVDVLGYSVDQGDHPAVGAVPAALHRGRFSAGEAVAIKVRGVGSVPRKRAKATAVILRVSAEGRGQAGRFAAFPAGGADLGTRSAPVPAEGTTTSVVVADVGRDGKVVLTSSVPAKVTVDVVGYVAG